MDKIGSFFTEKVRFNELTSLRYYKAPDNLSLLLRNPLRASFSAIRLPLKN